eukprot:4381945-Karenia_brevis.AAC.1
MDLFKRSISRDPGKASGVDCFMKEFGNSMFFIRIRESSRFHSKVEESDEPARRMYWDGLRHVLR